MKCFPFQRSYPFHYFDCVITATEIFLLQKYFLFVIWVLYNDVGFFGQKIFLYRFNFSLFLFLMRKLILKRGLYGYNEINDID